MFRISNFGFRISRRVLGSGFAGLEWHAFMRAGVDSRFAPGRIFELELADGSKIHLSYKDQGAHSRTKEGLFIHMVEMAQTGFIFLEVDEKRIIRRCVTSAMLECVSANGSFEKDGDCILAVNLPSDCELMNGRLSDGLCRVPPSSHILKPISRASSRIGKICIPPGCTD